MEEFRIVFTKVAEKDINGFNPNTRLRILPATKTLQTSPLPKGNIIRKLRSARIPIYRLRIRDFRVVYHIDRRKVVVLFVVDRKNLEKKLKRFL